MLEQLLGLGRGVREQHPRGVDEFGDVVRRDRGRHADRDALGAVRQHVREGARQHDRLLLGAVIGRAVVDRVLVESVEQQARDLGEARLGVSHRRGVIAVDVAEIALPLDQRPALREVLREAHQRVVDRLVAMRVVLADDVADDAGAFLERRARVELQLAHRPEHAAVHRLQAVANVRQRALRDGRQRIGEVALLERRPQVYGMDALIGRRGQLAHGLGLSPTPESKQEALGVCPPQSLRRPGPRYCRSLFQAETYSAAFSCTSGGAAATASR